MEGKRRVDITGRGISFIDNKKVKIKGSEVGFSLAKIEKVLELKQQLRIENANKYSRQTRDLRAPQYQTKTEHSATAIEKQIQTLLSDVTRVEYGIHGIKNEFKRKRKKKYRRKL